MSINSCINVRTLRSTDLGSLLDNSNRLARNLRHFSLVLSLAGFCKTNNSLADRAMQIESPKFKVQRSGGSAKMILKFATYERVSLYLLINAGLPGLPG